MSKIARYEFMGSWLVFWTMCVTIIGLPVALLYLVNATVRIEHELDDPERFVAEFRAGRFR